MLKIAWRRKFGESGAKVDTLVAASTMALAKAQPSMPRHFSSLNSFRVAVCLTLILFVSAVVHAEKIDQLKPQGYVSDFAGVLSPAAKAQLTALCTEVDQKAHAQIAVVTVKSLDGQPVEDYADCCGYKMGSRSKAADRGILILLAVEDRKYWTTVGYGLEPILPDGKVGGFGREAVPLLRNSDYDGALMLITRRIADVIAADRGVTLTGASPAPVRSAPQQNSGWSTGKILLLIFFNLRDLFDNQKERRRWWRGTRRQRMVDWPHDRRQHGWWPWRMGRRRVWWRRRWWGRRVWWFRRRFFWRRRCGRQLVIIGVETRAIRTRSESHRVAVAPDP